MTNSCCCGNLPVCILHLGENGLAKYRLAKKWEQFKIVLLFMDHPVGLEPHCHTADTYTAWIHQTFR